MYFITAFTNVDFDKPQKVQSKRCFGYFRKLEDAEEAVLENQCDMHEHCYFYIVIEEYKEGIHGWCEEKKWFKYNMASEAWMEIDKPSSTKYTCSHAIG